MALTMIDPSRLAIESIADEAPLADERLSAAFIRRQFARLPHQAMSLESESLISPTQGFREAAVLIPLVAREQGLQVLLTERAAHLHHHPGQISFPGGRVDAGDVSPESTALREAEEEIGLLRSQVEVLGRLGLYHTGTGFAVTPVVALVHPPLELRLDHFEVASWFEVPLHFLMNPRHHQRRMWSSQDGTQRRVFYTMPYQSHFIWGATAGMLRELFHHLRADLPDSL